MTAIKIAKNVSSGCCGNELENLSLLGLFCFNREGHRYSGAATTAWTEIGKSPNFTQSRWKGPSYGARKDVACDDVTLSSTSLRLATQCEVYQDGLLRHRPTLRAQSRSTVIISALSLQSRRCRTHVVVRVQNKGNRLQRVSWSAS